MVWSQAAREAAAAAHQQGVNRLPNAYAPAYRGVPDDRQAIGGSGLVYRTSNQRIWSTASPDVASQYAVERPFGVEADRAAVVPLNIDTSNYRTFDAAGQSKQDLVDSGEMARQVLAAKRGRRQGMVIHNMVDEPHVGSNKFGPQTHFVTFDPATIKGKYASPGISEPKPGLYDIMKVKT